MKFFTYFFLVIIVVYGGYSTFFYITEYKPKDKVLENLKKENRTLTEVIKKLKEEIENKGENGTGKTYKKNMMHELTKISTEENFEIRRAEKGVEINLPGIRLFNPGEENLSNEGLLIFSKLGKILKNASTGDIKVEGHTDDTKIGGDLAKKFPTNWELSAARAVNVAKYLQKNTGIPPERLSVIAYGQYQPIFPNDTEEHRRKNRRIVIVLEPPKEDVIADIKAKAEEKTIEDEVKKNVELKKTGDEENVEEKKETK